MVRREGKTGLSGENRMELPPDPLAVILGESTAIRQVKGLIRQVAPTDITILITGESGTGKELVARGIHELSRRHNEPMVILNCGAIPEGIFESEIFGHEKGSFTSADQRRQGYFEMADGGTLFLDEIGEMPKQVQVKMLRVLETGRFMRVGGSREIDVDVRVIAATNKDLGAEVSRGNFRQDLYYRLKAISISIPALRERDDDIPLLVAHFAGEFARSNKKTKPIFDNEALSYLQRHYWEGNVRELKNFVESVIALHSGEVITGNIVRDQLTGGMSGRNLPMVVSRPQEDLDRELIYRTLIELKQDINDIKNILRQSTPTQTREVILPFSGAEEVDAFAFDETEGERIKSLDFVEREQTKRVLEQFNGNRRLAAQALGIGERTLYRKIKQYGLR